MATIEHDIRIDRGSFADIDPVMAVMDSAFGKRFGEAWTRSQLAGILPMTGVTLMLAREGRHDEVVGFALFRAAIFIHELVHLPRQRMRHFRLAWNLLYGVPMLLPFGPRSG